MQKVIKQILLLFLIGSSMRLSADEYEIPSRPQIPALYETVRSAYGSTNADLTISTSYHPYKDTVTVKLNPAVSGYSQGKYSFSFYGNNSIQNGDKNFDYGLHRFFISTGIKNFSLGTGFGYDYDNEEELEVSESYTYSGNSIVTIHSDLLIEDWDENSVFGNVNGCVSLEQFRKLIFGIEMIYSVKRGVDYREQSEYSRNILNYSRSDISFNNYGSGAYRYRLKAGIGFMKEYISKKNSKRLIAADLLYESKREHSDLAVIDHVRPLFFEKMADNVQFSGRNNYLNSIDLSLYLSEGDPDAAGKIDSSRKKIDFNLKYMNVSLGFSGIKKKIRSLNQWMTDDIYYGVNERASTRYPLRLKWSTCSDLRLFSRFRFRLLAEADGKMELFENRAISGDCRLNVIPYIGCAIPFLNNLFFDLNFTSTNIAIELSGGENQFSTVFDLYSQLCIQLRISIKK
jgi:hypothetical protein